jgi:hypothetical protein
MLDVDTNFSIARNGNSSQPLGMGYVETQRMSPTGRFQESGIFI